MLTSPEDRCDTYFEAALLNIDFLELAKSFVGGLFEKSNAAEHVVGKLRHFLNANVIFRFLQR